MHHKKYEKLLRFLALIFSTAIVAKLIWDISFHRRDIVVHRKRKDCNDLLFRDTIWRKGQVYFAMKERPLHGKLSR